MQGALSVPVSSSETPAILESLSLSLSSCPIFRGFRLAPNEDLMPNEVFEGREMIISSIRAALAADVVKLLRVTDS